VALCSSGGALLGQVAGGTEGSELERSGRFAQAADFYLAILRADPANPTALLGLERVLPPLNRLPELPPLAERAVALRPGDPDLEGLLVRVWVTLNFADSARGVAERWSRRDPGDPAPYRELALALEDQGAFEAARAALVTARASAAQPDAFAVELGQLDARAGDWEGAARDWVRALRARPGLIANATGLLATAPVVRRPAVLSVLIETEGAAGPAARRLAADLLLTWGDPSRAWTVIEPTVRAMSDETTDALRHFADVAGAAGTASAWRARGLALSREADLADLASPAVSARTRADAGRAFLEAGDLVAARGEFERVEADSAAPLEAQQLAAATLISALVADGRLDSARTRLEHAGQLLTTDQRTALQLEIAQGWIRVGALDRADSALGDDSSLSVVAEHGWIALYRGDLARARALLGAAGPYAGDRRDVTGRAAMLALIDQISDDELPALGQALLALMKGDSARAVPALRAVAGRLPPAAGRADVLLLAARVAAHLGEDGERTAATLCADIMQAAPAGAAAPAAELLWAELLEREGATALVVEHLEHLILTYPESAVVPEARRALERARGAIPRS